MPRLSLALLGPLRVSLDNKPVTGFESNKVKALLTYLGVEADRPHARESLAGLLWPDYPDRSALANLRSALANLRHAIGDRQAEPPFLLIARDAIQFNLASDHTLDITPLRDLSTRSMKAIEQAVSVYRGTFLEGFSLADSPAFDEWVLVQREELRSGVLDALHRLSTYYEKQEEFVRSVGFAQRALVLEPWDEEAHRQVMRSLTFGGQRGLALAQFETCSRLLRQELGVDPAEETVSLADAIRSGTLQPAEATDTVRLDNHAALVVQAAGEPPFKGLSYFDEEDADLFFGRAALTDRLVAQLRQCLAPDYEGSRILIVIGASGSGKSSVVRAGLVPTLRRLVHGAHAAKGLAFRDAIHVFTPTARPLEALALSLTRSAPGVMYAATLRDDLARDPRSLHLAAVRLTQQREASHLLIVVDQFEELFSLCHDVAERKDFVDTLLYAAQAPGPTVVVIALRADFYDQCAPFENMRKVLSQNQQYLGAMCATELRQTIEEPACRNGWTFEAGLVDLLLREAGDSPGALPLLSHALLETWRHRSGNILTLAGYQAAGGVRGAIAKTAETTYMQLTAEQQQIARNIFLRLTEVSMATGDKDLAPFYTRRRATLAELMPRPGNEMQARSVLNSLANARLVTVSQDMAEVTHEALMQEWGRLRQWLEKNRTGLRLQRQLTTAAQEWEQMGRDTAGLYRGARLAQALEWSADHAAEFNLLERAFLDASQAEEEKQRKAEVERQRRELMAAQALVEEQRRRAEAERQRAETQGEAAQKLRRRAVSLALAMVALMVLAATALWLGQTASRNALARQEQALLATSRELAAAAVNALQIDPERGILLGLEAMATADTLEARNALHQALPELHGVRTISAHTAGSPGVSFSPDGARLASIGLDGKVNIWSTGSGKLERTFSGAPDTIGFDIDFSPNGKLLASSWSSQVLVWDAVSGELRWRLPGIVHGGAPVDRIDFSPDSGRLAVANLDGQPKVWDLSTGSELFVLAGHADICDAIDFSPDGKRLVTGDIVGTVKLWDAVSGKELLTLEHGGVVHSVTFSPDGRNLAAAGEDGRLLLWDISTQQLLLSLPSRSGLYDVTYLPDGKRLATVHQDGTAAIWDAATGQPQLTLAGHLSTVVGVAASPDNVTIATSGYDGMVRLWDTRPGREITTMAAHAGPVYGIDYAPDGSRLATVSADGTAKLWDPASGLLAYSLFPDSDTSGFASIAFSPDGRRVAAGGVDGTVLVGDAATGQTFLTLAGHTDMVWGLAFSPDGRRLATTSWDRTAKVWDLDEGKELITFRGHLDIVFGVAFSRDGRHVFTAGDRTAREWEVETGEVLRIFSGEGMDVYGLALSPDGALLALGRQDGAVSIWDLSTGEKLRQLTGHGALILRMAFNRDGTQLATASFDKYAKVWDLQSGQELATLYGNGSNVFGVAFHPDAQQLATAGGDNTVRIYTLDVGTLTRLARSRVARSLTTEECRRYLHREQCPTS